MDALSHPERRTLLPLVGPRDGVLQEHFPWTARHPMRTPQLLGRRWSGPPASGCAAGVPIRLPEDGASSAPRCAGDDPEHLHPVRNPADPHVVQPAVPSEQYQPGRSCPRHAGRRQALDTATEVAVRVGLSAELDKPASALTVAGRKRLELARALATRPTLLLLDEVLAGLNPSEVAAMLPVLRGLTQDGITVLMIEHVMQAVMQLCGHIHVLAQGRIIAAGAPAAICANPAVIEAYFGAGAARRLAIHG